MIANKKIVIFLIILAILVLVAILYFTKDRFLLFQNNLEKASLAPERVAEKIQAQIEVIFNKVFLSHQKEKKEIKKEEPSPEIFEGDIIETNNQGRAVLYFEDFSQLRLDYDTRVFLANYKEEGKTLVRVFELNEGKLWSRIKGVLAPQSRWEVRTSNVIAAVSGTSFGIERIRGEIKVIVAEGRVEVKVFHPLTKEVVPGGEIVIRAGEKVTVREEILPTLENPLKPEIVSEEEWEKNEWLNFNIKKDKELEGERGEIKIQEEPSKEEKIEEKEVIEPPKIIEEKEVIEPPKIIELIIRPSLPIDLSKEIIERTKIEWQAFLVLDNGTEEEITDRVEWQVFGQIGYFSENVFTAEIRDPDLLERGMATGKIVAVYIADAGQKYEAASPTLMIIAYAPELIEEQR